MSNFQQRILKFRAWTVLDGRKEFIYFPIYRIGEYDWGIFDVKPVFQQFTGLKDKNGKDIYEGDIVEYSLDGNLFQDKVVFENFGWNLINIEGEESSFPLTSGLKYRIIGNIFENSYDRLMSKIT